MDEIERSQIGKKSEPLRGWEDMPRKGIGTNYPPMRVKNALLTKNAIRAKRPTQPKNSSFSDDHDILFYVFLVVFIILVLIAAKVYGFW